MRHVHLALELAADQRLRVAVVVVDRGGHLVAAARMDQVGYANVEVARRKANAAVNFGVPTHDVAAMAGRDPMLPAALDAMSDHFIVLPGGIPIVEITTVVGGLGIAGGHYEQDRAIAEQVIARTQEGWS